MGIGKTIRGVSKVVKFDISKVAISSKATVNVDKNAVITATGRLPKIKLKMSMMKLKRIELLILKLKAHLSPIPMLTGKQA
jgi:hypothetical protein